ncbi:hypothetical protein H6P81_017549 [Aristolochia fimbriata]|uniref:Uncharacterized protein n=1 Tax=Aristolochia fimbriata TaxID=158543 RepID=A0AAV7DYF1_ARIFI|nr:hypothetical protein H6P81_017549 [Aristolochia fimbriata]
MIMGTTAEPYVSVAFSLTPMRHAPSDLVVPPAVFFSISGRKRYCNYVVEPDGSTGYVHGFTTHDMPPTYFDVPLFLILFAPSLWAARASSIVASSDDYYFRVGTAAHDRFLRYLCDLVPAKVDEAYSQGYCRLNVAVNVQMLIRRLVVPSAVLQPREGAGAADPVPSPTRVVVPAEMRLKELREIAEIASAIINCKM